jgi:8-oxo-dGTP diphosphatase
MAKDPTCGPHGYRFRRSGRVILIDALGCVLLIRFRLPRGEGHHIFWATPGGEIEGDETPLETARRELREEIGLSVELAGPVHHATGIFEFQHETVDHDDLFFVGRYEGGDVRLDGADAAERDALTAVRWWTPDAIEATAEPVYPPDLADVLRRLMRG